MTVLIQKATNGERLGRAALLVALKDLTMFEYSLEAGTERGDPHYHAQHVDSFYVLEGELEFQIDERAVRASAGTLLVAPRRTVHAFPIAIGSPARFLNLHTPGGFESYMRELTAMRSRGEQPNVDFLRSHDIYDV